MEHFGSLKFSWPFSSKATAVYSNVTWEINEKDNLLHVKDLVNDRIVSGASLKETQDLPVTFRIEGFVECEVRVSGKKYLLIKRKDSPAQYVWLNEHEEELIHYENTRLENTPAKRLKINKFIMANIPDKPTYDHIVLFFIGVYMLRRAAIKPIKRNNDAKEEDVSSVE